MVDINDDGFVNEADTDFAEKSGELDKHQAAKDAFMKKLTNPKTRDEKEALIGELAEYWTEHNRVAFDERRKKMGSGRGGDGGNRLGKNKKASKNKVNVQKINDAITSGNFSGLNIKGKKSIAQTETAYILKNYQGTEVLLKNDPGTNQELMNFWTGRNDIDYTEPYMFNQEGKYPGYIQELVGEGLPDEITNPTTKPKPE